MFFYASETFEFLSDPNSQRSCTMYIYSIYDRCPRKLVPGSWSGGPMAAAWLGHSTCPMPSYLHHPSPPLHAVRYLERFSFFLSFFKKKGEKTSCFLGWEPETVRDIFLLFQEYEWIIWWVHMIGLIEVQACAIDGLPNYFKIFQFKHHLWLKNVIFFKYPLQFFLNLRI